MTTIYHSTLPGGIQRLSAGGSFTYSINDNGWSGRIWPKIGCNQFGQNCSVGEPTTHCPPPKGCQRPVNTYLEFFFPKKGNVENVIYDLSLVNGYSLPVSIIPNPNIQVG